MKPVQSESSQGRFGGDSTGWVTALGSHPPGFDELEEKADEQLRADSRGSSAASSHRCERRLIRGPVCAACSPDHHRAQRVEAYRASGGGRGLAPAAVAQTYGLGGADPLTIDSEAIRLPPPRHDDKLTRCGAELRSLDSAWRRAVRPVITFSAAASESPVDQPEQVDQPDRSDRPWLVVGLGNWGLAYSVKRQNVGELVACALWSRHDLGSLSVCRLARRRGRPGSFSEHPGRALVDELRLGTRPSGAPGRRVVLAVPTTFMNESGSAVATLMESFSVELDHLIVVHDELDIPAETVRVKRGGGEGGHNGLRSVSGSLGTREYLRVRVGIGRPPGRMDAADFILRDFSAEERAQLPRTLDRAADAIESLVDDGLLASQQRFHAPDPS